MTMPEDCHPDCGPTTADEDGLHRHSNEDGDCWHDNDDRPGVPVGDWPARPKKTYLVYVAHTISTTVSVRADDPETAVSMVDRRDFKLPPRDEWDGHKDWEYRVMDEDGNDMLAVEP